MLPDTCKRRATEEEHVATRVTRWGRPRVTSMAGALALTVMIALAAPASAGTTQVNTSFGSGGVNYDHTRAFACDTKPDGYVVFTEYSPGDSRAVYDYNHTSSGCGSAAVGFCIIQYRVCTATAAGKSCTPWVWA